MPAGERRRSVPGTAGARVLIIEHDRKTPGGLVQEWFDRRTAGVDVLPIDVERLPISSLAEYGLLISLGSGHSANEDLDWIEHELELLTEADRQGLPVLGICFGSQILSRALGGRVSAAERAEIGWFEIGSREPGLVPDGPWFQWHFDAFEAPPGAVVLASNRSGPQVYRRGPHLGLQFHPEVTPEIVEVWIDAFRYELDREGVNPDRLLDETRRRVAGASAGLDRVLSWFVGEIANGGGGRSPTGGGTLG